MKNRTVETKEIEILEKVFGPLKRDGHLEFEYDKAADVFYISFNDTGEGVFCENLNDKLIIERGIYTGGVIGFRILDFKKDLEV
jgi:uncharacterized protein YuzE